MDRKPKFIITDNQIRLGHVAFHKDLANKDAKIDGGGLFHIDNDWKTLRLYGESHDFGPVTEQQVVAALPNSWRLRPLVGYKVLFSTQTTLEKALQDFKSLGTVPEKY